MSSLSANPAGNGRQLGIQILVAQLVMPYLGADVLLVLGGFWLLVGQFNFSGNAVHLLRMDMAVVFALRLLCVAGCSLLATCHLRRVRDEVAALVGALCGGAGRSFVASRWIPKGRRERFIEQLRAAMETSLADRAHTLASISHDLKSQLTRVSIRLQSIEDIGLLNDLTKDIGAMARMLDATLVYFSKTTPGEEFETIDVTQLIDDILSDVPPTAGRTSRKGSAGAVVAQPFALCRCLDNLISNAIKYGGGATVVLTDRVDAILVEVVDDGPGIPDEELGRVMSPFYRVDSDATAGTSGFGLGLSIAREIALRHGGSLALANRREGGLRVSLTIPRIRPHFD